MKILLKPQKFLLKFYYIGKKRFYGSQRQNNYLTIEEILLKALLEKKYINNRKSSKFDVSSRTDRFVSARGAAFSFISEKKPILMEINSCLPSEIGIWAYTPVNINFSSRFNAFYRHYKYIVPQSIKNLEEHHGLNMQIMDKACKELEGEHNFKNFSKKEKIPVKTIREVLAVKMKIYNGYLVFDFISKAFLRQQVRRMVKKILELGQGKINFDEFKELFCSTKEFSYQPADPNGLILWDINYGNKICFNIDFKSKERMQQFFFNQKIEYGHKYNKYKILLQDTPN